LLPLVDLETLATFVVPFVVPFAAPSVAAAAFDPFRAAFNPFGAAFDPFGAAFNPIVLACCAARIAKNSCLLEQPDAAKIRLTVGEVSSSSMVAREELEGACDDVMEKAIELFVGTLFLVTYGLSAVLRRRRN